MIIFKGSLFWTFLAVANLNVRASKRTVNKRLNKARFNASRPRRQTFLMLDHRRNVCSGSVTNKLRVASFLLVRREPFSVTNYGGQDPFQGNFLAEIEMCGVGPIMVSCFCCG